MWKFSKLLILCITLTASVGGTQVIGYCQGVSFNWAVRMGGVNWDQGWGIALDDSANVFTTGNFKGTVDFDPGPGVYNMNSGVTDATFVSKLDSAGNLIWAAGFIGSGWGLSYGREIVVDDSGNCYVTGTFRDTVDFDPGPGVYNLISYTTLTSFIVKLNPSGDLVWALNMGGPDQFNTRSLALDPTGNIYVTGGFQEVSDVDPGPGTYYINSGWGADIFLCKLDPAGNFLWARTMGDTLAVTQAWGLFVITDDAGNVYITGAYSGSIDIDPGTGSYLLTSQGSYDGHITKLDSAGNLLWAGTIGGLNADAVEALVLDGSGNVYITGSIDDGIADLDPGSGTFNVASNGGDDVFVSKLDGSGNFVWAAVMGGLGNDEVTDIAIDTSGNLYTTGWFQATADFNPGPAVCNLTPLASFDSFISKLDGNGNFLNAISTEGSGQAAAMAIALDAEQHIYTTGMFIGSADFDPSMDTFNLSSAGAKADAWIRKLYLPDHDTVIMYVSACGSYTSPSGNETYFVDGTYFDTIVPVVGCDSLITIILTLDSSSSDSITIVACDSFIVPSGDETYTLSGFYQDTIPNAAGCDSVITVNLSIINSTFDTLADTACQSYMSPSGNYTYTSSGIYLDTLPNAIGCDSIITVILTINNTTNVITDTVCGSYVVPSGDETYIVSGVYQDTIPNASGCDSLITINLTVGYDTNVVISESQCLLYTVPSGDETYFTSGLFQDTVPTTLGCDSFISINLVILDSSSSSIAIVTCNPYTVPSGDETYSASGIYQDTIPNVSGCDSVITIDLTIGSDTNVAISESACGSYTVSNGGGTYFTSGIFNDTLTTTLGCDSVITINLIILDSTSSTITEVACNSYTVPSGDEVYTVSGVYQDTIPNSQGCDSLLTINLTVGYSSAASVSEAACGSFVVPSGDETYYLSGTYQDTIPTILGCDSLITLNLTIANSTGSSIIDSVCGSFTSPSGISVFTESGTYLDTLSNGAGCDSIISISLTVYSVPIADAGNDFEIFAGESTTLNGSGGSLFSWSPVTGLSCSLCQSPTASPETSTLYVLTVSDTTGCSATDTVLITIDYSQTLFIPEIFSPNGDGENDFFFVQGKGINFLNMVIYDRWGEKVYENTSFKPNDRFQGWDGTFKGKSLTSAVYVYLITGTFLDGSAIGERGNFTLVR